MTSNFERDAWETILKDITIPPMYGYITYDNKSKVEEKKGMNFDEILNIYKKETLNIIAKGEEKRTEEIRKIDPVYVASKGRYEEFVKYLEDNKVYNVLTLELDCCISDKTDEEITEIANKATELRNTFYNILSKVNAMLEVCYTYEQGIEILKAYEILKPDLTLNVLDSEEIFKKYSSNKK